MRQLAVRLLVLLAAVLVGLGAAQAQTKVTPDCSSGHFYVDGYIGDGANAYASVDALCAALAVSNGSPSYMVGPGQCVLKLGNTYWSEVVWDLCSPSGLADVPLGASSGGITQAGTSAQPVFMAFAPASVASSSPFDLTGDKVGDYMALWALIVTAAVGVLAVKAIYNRFRVDHD